MVTLFFKDSSSGCFSHKDLVSKMIQEIRICKFQKCIFISVHLVSVRYGFALLRKQVLHLYIYRKAFVHPAVCHGALYVTRCVLASVGRIYNFEYANEQQICLFDLLRLNVEHYTDVFVFLCNQFD